MMTISETANGWANDTIEDLKQNYIDLGLKASGDWEKELEQKTTVTSSNVNVKIVGAFYTEYLVNGRSPNKNQDDDSIRAFAGWAGSTWLNDWVVQEGIDASPFAIAYKIARQGVTVPNANNPGTLLSDVLTENRIKFLVKEVGGVITGKLKSDIRKLF